MSYLSPEVQSALYEQLGEAQQELAGNNQYDGVFNRWLDYMEYPRRTAYELIARYKELVRIPHKQKNIFEALPISLSKTISAKSSEDTPAKAQAKSEVLAGDIDTLKDYRERIKVLERKAEQAEQHAEAERRERERLEEEKPYSEFLAGILEG